MLSGVLHSDRAISVNIQIMRIFTKLRQFLSDNSQMYIELGEMRIAIEKLAKKQENQDKNVELIFEFIDRIEQKLETPVSPERKPIGYEIGRKE